MTTIPRPEKLPSEILLERGWCKHVFEQGRGGPVCIRGAINLAFVGHPAGRNTQEPAIAAWLKDTLGFDEGRLFDLPITPLATEELARWNNAPERSFDDVISALRRTEHEFWGAHPDMEHAASRAEAQSDNAAAMTGVKIRRAGA